MAEAVACANPHCASPRFHYKRIDKQTSQSVLSANVQHNLALPQNDNPAAQRSHPQAAF